MLGQHERALFTDLIGALRENTQAINQWRESMSEIEKLAGLLEDRMAALEEKVGTLLSSTAVQNVESDVLGRVSSVADRLTGLENRVDEAIAAATGGAGVPDTENDQSSASAEQTAPADIPVDGAPAQAQTGRNPAPPAPGG